MRFMRLRPIVRGLALLAPVLAIVLLSVAGNGEGTPPPIPSDEEIDLSASIDTGGVLHEDVMHSGFSDTVMVSIGEGTTARTEAGDALETITITEVCFGYPPPPAGDHVIGCAYDFGPDGATFDPSITLALEYDDSAIPPGFDEQDLAIAACDGPAGDWRVLPSTVDPVNNIVMAEASGFTCFAAYLAAPGSPATAEQPGYHDLPLSQGWNLIGFPLLLNDTSVDVVLAGIAGNVASVWGYDNATKSWQMWAPGWGGDLTEIGDAKGYWIYMKSPDTLTVWGLPALQYE
jgi:hypothetical protein